MHSAFLAKFTQHPELTRFLVSTDDQDIAEQPSDDELWGVLGDGRGRNALGKLIMRIRSEHQHGGYCK